MIASASVASEPNTNWPDAVAVLLGAEHDRAGAVAEQRGGALVVEVGEARERVGADHEHGLGAPALDQRGAGGLSAVTNAVQAAPTSNALACAAPSAVAT